MKSNETRAYILMLYPARKRTRYSSRFSAVFASTNEATLGVNFINSTTQSNKIHMKPRQKPTAYRKTFMFTPHFKLQPNITLKNIPDHREKQNKHHCNSAGSSLPSESQSISPTVRDDPILPANFNVVVLGGHGFQTVRPVIIGVFVGGPRKRFALFRFPG